MAYNPQYTQAPQGVRFSSHNEEIAPIAGLVQHDDMENMSAEAQAELRNLSMTMQKSRQTQTTRMENSFFEPVSLPPSRVCFMLIQLIMRLTGVQDRIS